MKVKVNRDGFVLLELLVSLAILTAVATAGLNIIRNASFETWVESDYFKKIQLLRREPRAFESEPELELESELKLENGGQWRVYAYNPAGSRRIVFPVYTP